MAKSVTVYEKPTPHLGLPDWYAKQWELEESANNGINNSFELRNTGRTLRNESKIKTEWDTLLNSTKLDDRVKELSTWEEILRKLLKELSVEKKRLREARAEAEKDIENIEHPLKVAAECISMRDCRRGNELTYDEPDTEIKKELTVIEGLKKNLTEKVQAAWEKLNRLEQVEFEVNLDLTDKFEAIGIDKDNSNLNRNSAIVSYKPNALRIPKNAKTYDTWLKHCNHIKLLAENELKDTHTFRDIMVSIKNRAKNDIEAQQDATDYALRKRIHQTQKSRNQMEWQKRKVEKEMESLVKEIFGLEEALRDKIDIVKCTETRLENRTYRSGYELCRDEPEFGLKDQVLELRQTKKELLAKINTLKATFNGLEQLVIKIDRNLDDKQHSLMTDIKCLDIRSSLKTGNRAPLINQTDRNISLINLDDEIPSFIY